MNPYVPTNRLVLVALLALSGQVQGCVEVSGYGGSGLSNGVTLQAVDNGKTVCDGDVSATKGKISCNEGYQLHYEWNEVDGPLDIHYCNADGYW